MAKAGLLDLLRGDAATVEVPAVVAAEIRAHSVDAAVSALDAIPWLRVVPSPALPPLILAWDLGAGESSVLAQALANPGTIAVLDDLEARRCAQVLGIAVRGTLGLVLRARRKGSIPAAKPTIQLLRQAGLYLSEALVARILSLVGE